MPSFILPPTAPPEAFEIPLDDDNPESLIKKHPPKRLKRLEEQTSDPPSIEDLEEKLATAEIRRQQFLASRVQKTTTLEHSELEENFYVPSVIEEEDETEEADGNGATDLTEVSVEKEEQRNETCKNG
ncbi:uncharacterized protein LOC128735614 [Sabethes cyaneus]|uniref:uncharacterized protein LOC128735614 n=1 Tax=Sabethes cyaneus TaxID=53552 RepID=UPI00237D9F31|nr:uncharacterized protein LOC128735614 [Sabethes cyaneus]